MSTNQKYRIISATSPLGEDVLLFRRMTATEELGRLFEYRLELFSEHHGIDFDDLLGQNMTIRLELLAENKTRYFNGYVTQFRQVAGQGRYACYHATLKPWFWFLTRTADCRIFQQKTVPQIIKQVFRDHGFTDFEERLSKYYRAWEYRVQYRETDFNFLNRLMEQEGIYYFFKHENGKHTLVLCDSCSSHDAVPGYEEIPYFPPDQHNHRIRDHIFDWTLSKQVQPGAFAL